MHTQTHENEDACSQDAVDSSSGLDDTLPRIKLPRPTNLPLGKSTIFVQTVNRTNLDDESVVRIIVIGTNDQQQSV